MCGSACSLSRANDETDGEATVPQVEEVSEEADEDDDADDVDVLDDSPSVATVVAGDAVPARDPQSDAVSCVAIIVGWWQPFACGHNDENFVFNSKLPKLMLLL